MKTRRRLASAVDAATSLREYLQRALKKLDEESSDGDDEPLRKWLHDQIQRWQRRRDAEAKSSEPYRFFDGKCEGLSSVVRYLDEQAGHAAKSVSNRGYISARDTVPQPGQPSAGNSNESVKSTDTMSMLDTVSE